MTVELDFCVKYSDDYLSWLNDPEINKYTSRGAYPITEEQAREYLKTCQSSDRIVCAIYADVSVNKNPFTKHIGNVSLQHIDLINRSAELAILIGNKKAHGKGYGLLAAKAACEHGFNQLGLNRIYCGTHEENIAMQNLALKLGMKEEGRSRKAFFKHGQYADIIHYGMLKEEFINAHSGIHKGQSLPNNT